MRKIIASLALALFLSPQGHADTSYKSGIYAGAAAGYTLTQGNFTTFYTQIPPALTVIDDRQSLKKAEGSVTGSLFLGYRHLIQSIFVGIDVDLGIHNTTVRKDYIVDPDDLNFSAELQRHYSVIPSAVLGFIAKEHWHIFLKLGLGISKFTVKTMNNEPTSINNFSTTKTLYGFAPSIGVEYAVSNSISVLGSAMYEWYPPIKRVVGSEFVGGALGAPLPPETFTSKVIAKPRVFTIKFGVLFKV